MKYWKAAAFCAAMTVMALSFWLIPDSSGTEDVRSGEMDARAEDISGISCFSATYVVEYRSHEKGWLWSGDYLRKDQVRLDYGFRLDNASFGVVTENGRKILRVRLPKSEILAVRRVNLEKSLIAASKNVPVDERGNPVDLDRVFSAKVKEISDAHEKENIARSEACIMDFFERMTSGRLNWTTH